MRKILFGYEEGEGKMRGLLLGEEKRERNTHPWITWVDLLLIAGVLAVIGGSLFSLLLARGRAADTEPIRYTVCVRGVREELFADGASALRGARVTTANGATALGSVLSAELLPHREAVAELGIVEAEGYADLRVTVGGGAVKREGDGWRIGDVRIAAGMRGDFRIGGYFAENAVILSVWEAEQ